MTKRANLRCAVWADVIVDLLVAIRSLTSRCTKRERGVTLIELCVVMSIMGVLTLPVTNWTIDLFMAPLRAIEVSNEQTNAQSVSEALDSTIRDSDELSIGIRNPDGTINPVSLAGDQIVFTVGERCYRIFYLAHGIDQLREAESDHGCASIAPVRGPNQPVDGSYQVAAGRALHDPVLDDLEETSTSLSTTVLTNADDSDSFDASNPIFTYLDGGRWPLPTDPVASSQSQNAVYSNPGAAATRISAVTLLAQFGSTGKGDLAVKPVQLQQTITTQLTD